MIPEIDYEALGVAVRFYRTVGYKEYHVPWDVGSEEPWVVQQIRAGKRIGRGFAVTPCFRPDAGRSPYPFGYFVLNLFAPGCDPGLRDQMVEDARDLFRLLGSEPDVVFTKETAEFDGCNLEVAGVEVGSYGFRRDPEITFGTGLALPRFTKARHVAHSQPQANLHV